MSTNQLQRRKEVFRLADELEARQKEFEESAEFKEKCAIKVSSSRDRGMTMSLLGYQFAL